MTAGVKACLYRVWTQARNKKAKKHKEKESFGNSEIFLNRESAL